MSPSNQNANYSATISNPCGRKGISFNQSASNIWLAPCSCEPSPRPSRTQFTFVGSSNDSECTDNVLKLFDFNSTCPGAEPFFNATQPQPQVTGSFLVSIFIPSPRIKGILKAVDLGIFVCGYFSYLFLFNAGIFRL